MRVKKFKMPASDAAVIHDAIYYGGREVAQHLYPTHSRVYDEDAGVYTDYGLNNASVTWAQVHFLSLLGMAVVDSRCEHDSDTCEIVLLDDAVGAVVQLIHTLYSDRDLQARIWKMRAESLWESDGHYGRQSKTEFTNDMIARWSFDRKIARKICEQLQGFSVRTHHATISVHP